MHETLETPEPVRPEYGSAVPGTAGPSITPLDSAEHQPLLSPPKSQAALQDIPHHMLSGEFRRVTHGW